MPPITLTPAQFAKTAAAKKGGTYSSYVKYVTKARGARASDGGLASTPGVDIAGDVARLIAPIKAAAARFVPQGDAAMTKEATGYVQSQINPIVAQITDEAQGRATAGMGAIGSLTKELQAAMRPAAADAERNSLLSAGARAAVGQNLAGAATAEGAAAKEGIAGKLAAAGLTGDSSVFADNAGKLGAGIGTTIGAHGATATQDVLTRGHATAEQASTLPGIAGLAGIRSGRILQEQTNQGLDENVKKLLATVPGLTQSILESLKSRNEQTKTTRAQLESQAAQAGIS
jgi:hypothetical protein